VVPLRGLTSANWDELSTLGKVTDYLWHIALPVTAMVAGSFAVTAMLTKNAFLEEIRKQYVLTAAPRACRSARCCGSMCSATR
jgi:microcin C transport system permease protein